MSQVRLKHGTWLAICDGRKAMLVENQGDHTFPNLVIKEVLEINNLATHLQGSDRPGKVISSQGRHSATEEADFHRHAEESFLKDFGVHLQNWIAKEPGHELFVVAPAGALGILRATFPEPVRQAIAGELVRDYVKQPLYEIERHLKAAG